LTTNSIKYTAIRRKSKVIIAFEKQSNFLQIATCYRYAGNKLHFLDIRPVRSTKIDDIAAITARKNCFRPVINSNPDLA